MTRSFGKKVLERREKTADTVAYIIVSALQEYDGTSKDLSESFGISPQTFSNYKSKMVAPQKIEKIFAYYMAERSVSLSSLNEDSLPAHNPWNNIEQRLDLEKGLAKFLSNREKDVIERHFGLNGDGPYTLEEIGEEWGVTKERTRQIEKKALEKLGKVL